MKNIILLLRPHQWLKNLFIFLPLFFDRHLMDGSYLYTAILVFGAFSFMASAVYCFNDIWDVESDKQHPIKCKRPIASGAISKGLGYLVMFFCVLVSCLFIYNIGEASLSVFLIIALYFILNIAYCVRLKQITLIDVFIISIGFVLRVLAGGISTGIYLSHWIMLMTFLLALFLAFAKRRDDVVIYEGTGVKARRNIGRYNLVFMNQAISIIASVTMVCYVMYTVSEEVTLRVNSQYLYATSVFVLLGLLRYLQLTIVDVKSGSPTKVLLKDHFIQSCIVLWMISFFLILYI